MQELSAIHMNAFTRQIVDVFHGHAFAKQSDWWARLHVHGLNKTFLERNGEYDDIALLQNFKNWLSRKNVLSLYANNPRKESDALDIVIEDIELPPWAERIYQPYHQMALSYKCEFIPILNKRCCFEAHSVFKRYPIRKLNETEIAKRDHGFHCSLYDAYELYLYYVSKNT